MMRRSVDARLQRLERRIAPRGPDWLLVEVDPATGLYRVGDRILTQAEYAALKASGRYTGIVEIICNGRDPWPDTSGGL